jgi:glycerophosphoryl diester phosphodiesterase
MNRSPLGPAPLIYAHRGDRSRAPDNTIEAYRLAVEAGADGIELDVRRTRDDVLILVHDPSHGNRPPFAEMSLEEVRSEEPSIPTFDEALAFVPSSVYLNVEIKNTAYEPGFDPSRRIVDETLSAISSIDDPSRILMSSFDPESVRRSIEIAPNVLAGLLIGSGVEIGAGIDMALALGVQAIHPPMTTLLTDPRASVDRCIQAGLAVVVWNANTPKDVEIAVEAGVDVIITDDPGMARAVIGRD